MLKQNTNDNIFEKGVIAIINHPTRIPEHLGVSRISISYAMRHNDANKMTPLLPPPPTICVIPRISTESMVF